MFAGKIANLWSLYPLVNIQKAMENHYFLMGKSTINGPFSIAMLVYQRVTHFKSIDLPVVCEKISGGPGGVRHVGCAAWLM